MFCGYWAFIHAVHSLSRLVEVFSLVWWKFWGIFGDVDNGGVENLYEIIKVKEFKLVLLLI